MKPLAKKEAYELLGIMEAAAAKQPQITSHLRHLGRAIDLQNQDKPGIPRFSPIHFLRSSDAPEAQKFLEFYDSVPSRIRKAVPIEAYCAAAQVSPLRLLEIIAGTAWRLSASTSSMLHAMAQPTIVEKTIEFAQSPLGIQDRIILHKASGFLPMPKTQTTINVMNQQSTNATVVASTPPPEKTIRTLVDRFNEKRALTQPVEPPALAYHNITENVDSQESYEEIEEP
jgi:hypothetical protein